MANRDQESYFRSIPWCRKLLDNPGFRITTTHSRQFKESTEDSLLAETLKTDNTVRAVLSLASHPRDLSREGGGNGGGEGLRIDEIRTLVSLGGGMNGHSHILHGGIVATLLDEVMGILLTSNKDPSNPSIEGETFTAYLHVNYLKPVDTPQTVVVIAKFRELKGRKHFIESTIEDGQGAVLAKGEALWLGVKESKAKL
jgi:acyl-coenzyme A thioesterase PaaI-like protein